MASLLSYRQKTALTSLALILGLLALSSHAQTVHAIVVADTKDPILYTACKRDIETMHRQFVQLAAAINYQLSEQVIAGEEFTQKRLNDVVRTLSPGPDDILFLYYTGHGYNASQRAGRFPVLYLEKKEKDSRQNPGLLALHKALKAKKARLCITMGDCCNQLIPNMRGMAKKAVTPRALVLTNDSLNAVYRKLFLDIKGDALIASSRPPEQACAHPDSGSFYTRSFDEALELASRYNKTISWETLLRDTQTRLTRHQATRKKQSIFMVSLDGRIATEESLITARATDQIESNPTARTEPTISYDLVNRHLTELTDKTLSTQQRQAAMNRLTNLFTKQAPIDIYVDTTLGEVQPIETFLRRIYLNGIHIQQINFIERLSKVAAGGKQYERAAFTLTEADTPYVDNRSTVARQKDLPTVLRSLAGQLNQHLPTSAQQLTLEMFTYKRCGVNTPLSDRIFATLGSCLQKLTAIEIFAPGQNSDSPLAIRGSYQEDLNTLRITTELYDTRTNQVLTVLTNTDLPLAWISEQQLTLRPDNYQQIVAIRDSIQQKASSDRTALTVTIRTDKGRTSVEYWEGSQLVVEAKANRPCHVRLVYVLADGTKTLLENDFVIKPGQENGYVRIRPDLPFDCSAPFGMEHLLAYASEDAFCPVPNTPNKTLYLRKEDGYDLFVGSIAEVIKASTCTISGTQVSEDRIQITTRGLN